jgi:hypothetical protein
MIELWRGKERVAVLDLRHPQWRLATALLRPEDEPLHVRFVPITAITYFSSGELEP